MGIYSVWGQFVEEENLYTDLFAEYFMSQWL